MHYNKNETHLLQFFVDSITVIICVKKVKKKQQALNVREFKINQYVKPCFSLSSDSLDRSLLALLMLYTLLPGFFNHLPI